MDPTRTHNSERLRSLHNTGPWAASDAVLPEFGTVHQENPGAQHVGTACVPSHVHEQGLAQQSFDPNYHTYAMHIFDPNYHTYAMHISWSGHPGSTVQGSDALPQLGDGISTAQPASSVQDYRKIAPDLNATYYHCPHLFGYAMTDLGSEGGAESESPYGAESFDTRGTSTSQNHHPQRGNACPAEGSAGSGPAATQHLISTPHSDGSNAQWANDLQPQEQTPRHAGDLYTPRWVRGNGTAREGWCDICHSWKVLKNSAYWYDKTFVHSISTITGRPFDGPIRVRAASSHGNAGPEAQTLGSRSRGRQRSSNSRIVADMQGQCGHCGSWIKVNSNQRQTANGALEHTWGLLWLKHAHKCHSRRHGAHSRTPN